MTAPGSPGGSKLSPLQRIAAATAAIVAMGVAATAVYQKVSPTPTPPAVTSQIIVLDATHTIVVAPSDSGTVVLMVTGADHPLVAEAYPNIATAWATDVDSQVTAKAATGDVLELSHNSDVLQFARADDPRPNGPPPRYELGVAIGPTKGDPPQSPRSRMVIYQVDISRSAVDSLTAAIRAASGAR